MIKNKLENNTPATRVGKIVRAAAISFSDAALENRPPLSAERRDYIEKIAQRALKKAL